MAETRTPKERVLAAVVSDAKTGCWIWQLARNGDGYGHVTFKGSTVSAHRFSYEAFRGPIPTGLVLDHIVCDNPPCVNPWHLTPCTRWQNTLRGRSPVAANALKTHCKRGHPLSGANLYFTARRRQCRACNRVAVRAYRNRLRGAA